MTSENAEAAISYVVRYTSAWFKRNRIGEFEGTEAGSNPYFKDSNHYWVEFQEVVEAIDTTYDCTLHPLLYVDLCEYVVRCLRLYFFVREMQFKPIDRGNFEALMGCQESLKAPA